MGSTNEVITSARIMNVRYVMKTWRSSILCNSSTVIVRARPSDSASESIKDK